MNAETEKKKTERMKGKRNISSSKLLMIFVAAVMLSLCVAVPLAELHNEDNVVAGDHREPAVGETPIYDYSDFQFIRDDLGGKFILMNNIVITGNFRPIGYETNNTTFNPFTGSFDGNGYVIDGMNVGAYSGTNYYQYAGLFAQLDADAKVSNVGLINGSVTSTVSNNGYAGGVVAYIPSTATNVEITNCYNTGSVSASSSSSSNNAYAGGIAGRVGGITIITNCYNTGSVSASSSSSNNAYAGGIAGDVYGTITNCYNTGSVSASSSSNNAYAGGIAGRVDRRITDCYNTGSVSATASNNAFAGGIAGYVYDTTISNCYNTGSVLATGTGTKYFGGVVGLLYSGTVDNASCFYLSTCVTSPTNTNGTSKSDGELRMGSTYPDTGTYPWDFENTWFLSPIDGYSTPHLKAFVPQIYLHPVTTATASDSVHVEPYPSVFAQLYGWQKYSAVNGWEDHTNLGADIFTLDLGSSSVGDRYRFFVEYGKLVPGDPIRRITSLETTVATAGTAYTVDASVSYRTEASGAATEGYGHIIKGGNYSVKAGSNIEFAFEAEVGHALTDVIVNGLSVFSSVLNNRYEITSVSDNIVIEAEFSTLVDLTVAVNGLDGGDTIVMKYVVNGVEQRSTAPGIIKVPLGAEVTISFTYSGTKLFQRWSGYASGLESSITFDTPTVTGSIAVTAYFLPSGTPTLTLNYNGPNNDGTVEYILYKGGAYDSSGIIPFAGGTFTFPTESTDTIYLTAFNGTDDVFQAWSGVPYADLLSTSISVTAISTPSVITAYFADSSSDTVTINNNIPNGDGRIAYILYKNGTNVAYGSIPMSSGTFTIHMESTDTIDLAADDGMNDIFQRWADDILGLTSNLSTIDRSISPSVASGSVSVTAYFVDVSSSNVMTVNYSGPNNDGTVGYVLSKSGTPVASGDIPFAGGTFSFPMESTDTINLTASDGTDDIFQIWSGISNVDPFDPSISGYAISAASVITAYFVDSSSSNVMTVNYDGPNGDGTVGYNLYKGSAISVASGDIPFVSGTFSFPMALTDTTDLIASNGTDDIFQVWSGISNADPFSPSIPGLAVSTTSTITAYFVDSSSDIMTVDYIGPNNDGTVGYTLYKGGVPVASGDVPFVSGTFSFLMESSDTIDLIASDGTDDIFQTWSGVPNVDSFDPSISGLAVSAASIVTAYFVDSSSEAMTINYDGPSGDGTVGYALYKSGTIIASGNIPFAGGTFTFLMESTDTIDLTAVDGTDDIFQRWADDIWNPASDRDSINKTIVVSLAFGSVSVTAYFVDASLSELLTLNYSGVSNDGAVVYALYKNALLVASGQITFVGNVFCIPMGSTDAIDLGAVNGTDDTFQRWIDTSGEYNTTLYSVSISYMTGPLDITAHFVSGIGHSVVKITYEGILGGEVWYGFGTSHEGMIRFTGGIALIVLGAGEDVILSAENDTARFSRWIDNIGSTYSVFTKDITVNGNADISVNFINLPAETLRIVASADNNSTISPEGTNTVSPGNSVTFAFSANPGYRISKVIVDGYEVQASGTYTFSDVRSSHTISVFSEKDNARSFTVAVDYNEGLGYIEMSVNGSPFARYDGPVTVTEGSSVVLKATPTGDNSFGGWTGTIRSSDQELRITNISGNVSEQADFNDNGSFPMLWIAMIIIVVIAANIIAFFVIRSSRSKD